MFKRLAVVLCLLTGCFGQSSFFQEGEPKKPSTVSEEIAAVCGELPLDVPVVPIRRLNPEQFKNSARDLLGSEITTVKLAEPLGTAITELEVEKLAAYSDALIAKDGHLTFLPCADSEEKDAACVSAFIDAFGERAFRRPVTQEEHAWLMGVYEKTLAITDVTPAITFEDGIDTVAKVILQSPQHLYLPESGVVDESAPPGLRRTTGYERASRLSFFLWNSTPDEVLLEAAAKGELDTVEGLQLQARRMLEDPRSRETVRRFASKLLGLDATPQHVALELTPKDEDVFDFDSPALRRAMRTESEALFEDVFFQEQGTFQELMTSRRAYVNGPLAELYGVTGPSGADEFSWVQLDASQRAGLFTRAAFLTHKAGQTHQSPIRRGVHLYREALCQSLGDPPPNANDVQPKPAYEEGHALSTRESAEARTMSGSCAACHGIINPLGFSLENYDAMGHWQTTESVSTPDGDATVDIDSNVSVTATDFDGAVSGPTALSEKLAASEMAQNCMADRWVERAIERPLAQADACTLALARDHFRKSGGNLKELVVHVATSAPTQFVRP